MPSGHSVLALPCNLRVTDLIFTFLDMFSCSLPLSNAVELAASFRGWPSCSNPVRKILGSAKMIEHETPLPLATGLGTSVTELITLLAERTEMILFLWDRCEGGTSIDNRPESGIAEVLNIEDAPVAGSTIIEWGRVRKTPSVLGVVPGLFKTLGGLRGASGLGLSAVTYCEKWSFKGPRTLSITRRGELILLDRPSFLASARLFFSFFGLDGLDLKKGGGLRSGGVYPGG